MKISIKRAFLWLKPLICGYWDYCSEYVHLPERHKHPEKERKKRGTSCAATMCFLRDLRELYSRSPPPLYQIWAYHHEAFLFHQLSNTITKFNWTDSYYSGVHYLTLNNWNKSIFISLRNLHTKLKSISTSLSDNIYIHMLWPHFIQIVTQACS